MPQSLLTTVSVELSPRGAQILADFRKKHVHCGGAEVLTFYVPRGGKPELTSVVCNDCGGDLYPDKGLR